MTNKKKRVVSDIANGNVSSEFDISRYMLSTDADVKVLTIPETGDEFQITIKPISWSKRNKLVSKCLHWDDSGEVDFDGDAYVRGCLKEMIIDAPWGVTTEVFLTTIDARLGSVLEQLVPKAFEDTSAKIDEIKKVR